MRRREILGLLGSGLVMPRAGWAQQPRRVPRIAFLATGQAGRMSEAFRNGLGDLGYVEGKNILVEYRFAGSKVERFPALARELVGLGVDLILATNSLAARAVQQATSTIPVVVPVMGDPVRDGLVSSLARPGGNITGLTFLGPELLPKRLSLLKEALPAVSRVAGLWHPGAYGERTMDEMMKSAEAAARSLDLSLKLVAVKEPDDFDRAFSDIAAGRADALIVFPSSMLFTELASVARLANRQRLPAIAMGREFAEFGGLMAYGASVGDLHRRAAGYVDKILRGARPEELPIEQPTEFELVINLKTARTLGLTLPPALVARADEVIE
jgi:putative ABC transport system substrate-binding protein